MNVLAAVGLMPAHMWIAALSQAATGSLVAAVWQGLLLAAAVGVGLSLLPKAPAAVRFSVWFGVFALVAALPVISLLPHAAGGASTGGRAWLTLDERWSLAIAAVWLTASMMRATTLAVAAFRVRALWKRAMPLEMDGVSPAGVRRAQVCTSDEVDRPTVIGFFAPKILIPRWLLEKLTPAELEQIVLHEVGHLGRADDWLNLLQKIALVIFPLNPALAWVERRLCFERELAVDERVLQAFAGKAGAAKAYATCLATLAEYRLGQRSLALALGALGRESELSQRVGRILRREAGMKPLHSKLVLGGAMLGLLVAATGFERCPQVVGFAEGAPAHEQIAATPIDASSGFEAARSGRPIRAFGITYKAPSDQKLPPVAHTAHQTVALMTVARQSVPGQPGATGLPVARAAGNSARMVRTLASVPVARNRLLTVSDTEPAQPAEVVTQWVVVTAWQNGQATRMVFTTARTAGVTPQEVRDGAGAVTAGEQMAPTGPGPSYAAVPVRGGWLVFQL